MGGRLVNGRGILSSSWKEKLLSLTQELDEQAVKNDYHLCCLLLEKKSPSCFVLPMVRR